ncbi:MAG: Sodium/glucose cotransporter [Verrucomicrobia bacterium ADurb.Bin118]|jgi:Na+/proline symporter|nr:MAG: Sodium/glucose cotransporter [Verrucomicrobia bacterium ADurb.Bin118]
MNLLDWLVVAASCAVVFAVGLGFARRSSQKGATGYFAGGRDVPWWAIGLSNTATYSSGTGAFVMLVLVYGLSGNWLWWTSWIVWMPLVAIVWARMWRRMQIVTTAELISLRYGGSPAVMARKIYAFVCCFGFAVLIIAYITGFFAKTIAPLCPLTTWQVLLIFGGITVIYTMFGGLLGVVYADVVQFGIMITGCTVFFVLAVMHQGSWGDVLQRVQTIRPTGLTQTPPTEAIGWLTVAMLFLQGWFFAGSPTAGEGMTAQRFMAARDERHAMGGQLFNAFLALSFRTLPLIGLGVVAMALFWTSDLVKEVGAAPAGTAMLKDPAHAWGELVNASKLPHGFIGLLVAAEVAAFMGALSALLNWGGSFVVNDLLPARFGAARDRIWVSRLTTLSLFIFASAVTILFVDNMVSWFLFINSAMVIFLLPLSWFRFFWWRFNVWGELAAVILGLPLSILVWFVLDFQSRPIWQGLGLLFGLSFAVLFIVTLFTPPESKAVLKQFYARCRPPGFWKPIQAEVPLPDRGEPTAGRMLADCLLGIVAAFCLVLATNAVFVRDWPRLAIAIPVCLVAAVWLLRRVLESSKNKPTVSVSDPQNPVS